MLRLWPDLHWCALTRVFVTGDQLLAEHIPAGIRSRKVVAKSALESLEPLALQAAMSALIKQLPATDWQRMEIYLADQHVHLMALPAVHNSGNGAGLSNSEQSAYARVLLMQTYGDAAGAWPFRIQDVPQSQSSLLVTIPALQGLTLQTLLTPRKYVQVSVQPYATALWSQSKLPPDGSVVTAEPQMLRLLQLQNGAVLHVSSLTSDVSDTDAVSAWLLRERMLLGAQATPCYWLSESGCVSANEAGRRLSKALAGQLSMQQLQSNRAITSLWPEVKHSAIKPAEVMHVA